MQSLTKRDNGLTRFACLVLSLALTACRSRNPSDTLTVSSFPQVGETECVSITLFEEWSQTVRYNCDIQDGHIIRDLVDCLTPAVPLQRPRAIPGQPPVGKLEFKGVHGVTVVDFVFVGKGPLEFRIDGKAHGRGGAEYPGKQKGQPSYQGYQSDHIRLYGNESLNIDEGLALYYKLQEICQQAGAVDLLRKQPTCRRRSAEPLNCSCFAEHRGATPVRQHETSPHRLLFICVICGQIFGDGNWGTETETRSVLTEVFNSVSRCCHAKNSASSTWGFCLSRPEPIRRQDAYVPQGVRL
jgi:hypothetical protein